MNEFTFYNDDEYVYLWDPNASTYVRDESTLLQTYTQIKDLIEKRQKSTFVSSGINKVIFNRPATIVYWKDGSKTVVKAQDNDVFDPEKGLAMAIAKKALGNKGNYYNQIKKWVDTYKGENPEINKLERRWIDLSTGKTYKYDWAYDMSDLDDAVCYPKELREFLKYESKSNAELKKIVDSLENKRIIDTIVINKTKTENGLAYKIELLVEDAE